MNIFVLCTGRSGSVTFYNVCKHIKNYTTGHESRKNLDIVFPDNHIEIDNRLSWFLGTLNENFGNDAIYVNLRRNKYEVAKSYSKRFYYRRGITKGFKYNLLHSSQRLNKSDYDICLDMVQTMENNINFFLENKSKKVEVNVENFENDIPKFWRYINAEGDINLALNELNIKYNPTKKSIIKKIKNYLYK